MTITTSQLDELERNARGEMAGDGCSVPVSPDVTIQLVAIARAALAWNEARKRIAPARDALDDVGTQSARQALDDAHDDLDQRQTALDAALRGAP
jgi:hypothetical protein